MNRKEDDIYAVEGGVILYAIRDSNSPYGKRIYLRHNDGSTALYAHLNAIFVKDGDTIEAGQCISQMGSTGYGLGNKAQKHLHISYFSKSAPALTAEWTSEPSFWIKLNVYPCNTKVSNPYGSKYCNPKLKKHEGLDFSGIKFISNWENGVDAMRQDYMSKKDYPEVYDDTIN